MRIERNETPKRGPHKYGHLIDDSSSTGVWLKMDYVFIINNLLKILNIHVKNSWLWYRITDQNVTSCNVSAATAAAKSLQSCLTLCDPIDGSPPGFPVPGILQARILESVAISFSNAWKWKVKAKSLSPVWLLATPWTTAYQSPPSMGFSRQVYWSRVPSTSSCNVSTRKQKEILMTLGYVKLFLRGHEKYK